MMQKYPNAISQAVIKTPVKEEYLDRMFRTIYAEYGNVERFLRRGLYLNQKTVTDLQSKYLI